MIPEPCPHVTTEAEELACTAAWYASYGMPWRQVASLLDYPSTKAAHDAGMAHLLIEYRAPVPGMAAA